MPDKHLTETRFDSLELAPCIQSGLVAAGFERCTPVQAATLPIALGGRDVAGQAQTGTGKTAAFLIATLQRLIANPPTESEGSGLRAIILAPTRELAVQIHKDATVLAGSCGLRLGLAYGGTGYRRQREELERGVDLLIGTPGRIIDYHKQGVFRLDRVEVVVIDEADRMFDLGFIRDVRYVFRRIPKPERRLGLLFSATLSYRVTELAYEHMNQPQLVEIEAEQVTVDRVRQRCYMAANDEKIPLLIGMLRGTEHSRVLVFANTKRETERIWGYLTGNGIDCAILSGDVPQKKRLRLLARFQEGQLPVLVATDVAARGLHIPGVTHVFNYDLPEEPEDYVHRIGRTARAGAQGDAISFVCETYAFSLPDIEQFIDAKISVEPVTSELLADVEPGSRVPVERTGRLTRRPKSAARGKPDSPAKPEAEHNESARPKRPRRRRKPRPKGGGEGGSPAIVDP